MKAIAKDLTTPAGNAETKTTAKNFVNELVALGKISIADNSKYFADKNKTNKFIGIRMSSIFELAKSSTDMSLSEIEKLLDSDYYEARMGAVSIMDFQARGKKLPQKKRAELFDLYIKRHDRINNWDLVDRAAPYVVGGFLADKPRTILYKLAKSKNVWERRTAIVSTYFFIRKNDLADTFKIAEILVHDKHELINKVVGSWVREAGKRDQQRLLDFLDQYALTMPRVTLRYAIEKLDKKLQPIYMNLKKG